MDEKAYTRLNKLMMLTQSPNDGEALTALRKANAILAEHNWNWDSVFQQTAKPSSEPDYDEEEDDFYEEIMEAFAVAFSECTDDFRDFLESLHDQFSRTGRLSEKQLNALFKSRDNARRRQKRRAA